MHVAEHIGTIIKDEVERKRLSENRESRHFEGTLKMHISDVLTSIEIDIDLFETLQCSYPCSQQNAKILFQHVHTQKWIKICVITCLRGE